MAENESFFRKVVRFVANPATDWTELNSRQDDTRELELEKSELKAMIERKRRNDFVRKREFDMLRRVRREGLSPEQLAALGGSSRLDDSEARLPDSNTTRHDGVKAKIDEIEQQMVGDAALPSTGRRDAGSMYAPTEPVPLSHRGDDDVLPPVATPAPVQVGGGLPPLSSANGAADAMQLQVDSRRGADALPTVEVNEVVHDPDLDEAVIAFANADFEQCEEVLRRLIAIDGARARHPETWLVLFDLYRATGQQPRFESLAVEYAQAFGWSAPQWYSLPRLVAETIADEPAPTQDGAAVAGEVGWICPEHLDTEGVTRLRSQALQMPLPWVFDWSALRRIDAEAAMQLSMLMRLWSGQSIEMRWLAGDRLLHVLQEAAPTGVRDADPAFWLTRLDALRLANRADQFDDVAIDYCVTYEVSPPSWEAARCKVHISHSGLSTRTPPMSMVSEVSTSFMESGLDDDETIEVAHVELSGQLVGDIGPTLGRLQPRLGQAPVVSVSCARLIRVDFIAAGDLLNWVLSRRNERRAVHFVDTHRLVALFFGAMGINEHARVIVRKV